MLQSSGVARRYNDFLDDALSYNISRKSRLSRKYGSGILFGCCILIVMLSIFNLATTGYDMRPRIP